MTNSSFDAFFKTNLATKSLETVAYTRNRLQRDTELRDEESLALMMAQTGARYFLFDGERIVLEIRATRRNALYCQGRVEELGGDMDKIILLGSDPGERHAPRLALPLKPEAVEAIEADPDYEFWSIRGVALKAVVPPDQLGAIAQARSLLHWHENHGFCAKCGHPTMVALAGARRDCPSCNAMHFPRTDPVVIMLAIHRDEEGTERVLLGNHVRFDGPMYSTLAGFMEQGETLEDAVRREIHEEAGIKVGEVCYLASQPWPFPSSLMIGCYGEAISTDIDIDEAELRDARWFTRQEVREMLSRPVGDSLPHVPGGGSIAAFLVQNWAEQV